MPIVEEVHDEYAAADKTTFLHLPNEVLTKIVLKLNQKDRDGVSGVNHRLYGVETRAGHREFKCVYLTTLEKSGPIIKACDLEGRRFEFTLSDDETTTVNFFKHSTTRMLRIKVRLNEEEYAELGTKLRVILKTLELQKLDVTFSNEWPIRLTENLLRGCARINEIGIAWTGLEKDAGTARKALIELPSMSKCTIISHNDHLLIDDGLFLQLACKSNHANFRNRRTTVTAKGLDRAFEIVRGSKEEKIIKCVVSTSVIEQFIAIIRTSRIYSSSYVQGVYVIKHSESGAYLKCFKLNDHNGDYAIEMHTRVQ